MVSIMDPSRVMAKDFKIVPTYYCFVSSATLIVWVEWMPKSKTGVTHYHALLGLPERGHAIKGLVACNC